VLILATLSIPPILDNDIYLYYSDYLIIKNETHNSSTKIKIKKINSIKFFRRNQMNLKICKYFVISKFMWYVFIIFFVHLTLIYGQNLRIYHIDVEQADATLIVSPNLKTLLIDSGKNGHGSRIKAIMNELGVDTINIFVCTHYHEDHYGGIDDLVSSENVVVNEAYDRGDKQFLPSSKLNETSFNDYQQAVGENAKHLMRGETIPFDSDISVTCISSGGVVLGEMNPVPGVDENDMSISLLIQYEGFRYFIGGDIEKETETKIAELDQVQNVDVYQANHHGAATSSSENFMNDIQPAVIIISNGNNKKYQHPRKTTLDFFSNMNPKPLVFQTNKYLQGGSGGNMEDEFIADLESTNTNGTILITVNLSTTNYIVNYRDKEFIFPIKLQSIPNSLIIIESLLANPIGADIDLEEVTLRNKSGIDISVGDWFLKDESGRVWSLSTIDVIRDGESVVILRKRMPMNLDNDGDTIWLIDSNGKVQDTFNYAGSQEGIRIETGH